MQLLAYAKIQKPDKVQNMLAFDLTAFLGLDEWQEYQECFAHTLAKSPETKVGAWLRLP